LTKVNYCPYLSGDKVTGQNGPSNPIQTTWRAGAGCSPSWDFARFGKRL
jgi:hypothetical protein